MFHRPAKALHWDATEIDPRRLRHSPWSWVAVLCGAGSLGVWFIVTSLAHSPQLQSVTGLPLLLDLFAFFGAYLSIWGTVTHAYARYRIRRDVDDAEIRWEGDFTATLGFALCLVGGCLLQTSTGLILRPANWIASPFLSPDTALAIAQQLDQAVFLVGLIVGGLYLLISGAPVFRWVLLPSLLIGFPLLLLAAGLLRARQESRTRLFEYRAGRVHQAFTQRQLLLEPRRSTHRRRLDQESKAKSISPEDTSPTSGD